MQQDTVPDDTLRAVNWKVIGASVTGNSHQATGRACEDASAWHVGRGGACLAVADGAGSRPRSRDGAALAVRRAVLLASAGLDGPGPAGPGDPGDWLRQVFADVREQIAALAVADGNDVADYATTLAVAVLAGGTAVIGQVGDTIAVVGQAGGYRSVAPPGRPEYVNETTFITGAGALDDIRITVHPAAEVDSVFLATDGLRFKILDDPAAGAPYPPFFQDLDAYARSPDATAEALGRFLTHLDDQSGDDKTLVAAVRLSAPAALPPS